MAGTVWYLFVYPSDGGRVVVIEDVTSGGLEKRRAELEAGGKTCVLLNQEELAERVRSSVAG